jgi:hypothetical protein
MNKLIGIFFVLVAVVSSLLLTAGGENTNNSRPSQIDQIENALKESVTSLGWGSGKTKKNNQSARTIIDSHDDPELDVPEDPNEPQERQSNEQQTEETEQIVDIQSLMSEESELQDDGNTKPEINASIQQKLQTLIYQWQLTEGDPANLSLDFSGLFNDPENDLLTYKASVTSSFIYASTLIDTVQLSGTIPAPDDSSGSISLQVAAKDSFHDDEEDPWTVASFTFPLIDEAQEQDEHPLIGKTFYYISFSNHLGNQQYDYPVAYCNAVLFINGRMFFATSDNKTTCPDETQLKSVGSYTLDDESLLAFNTQEQTNQVWSVNYQQTYSDEYKEIVVNVTQSLAVDTYLLNSLKNITEQRLHPTQKWQTLSYYFPLDQGEYAQAYVTFHLEKSNYVQGENGEFYDADININIVGRELSCAMIEPYFNRFTFAGVDQYGDLISEVNSNSGIGCLEYQPVNNYQSVFIDFNFEAMTELIDGEIYSIIGQVKSPYRNEWEDIKFNVSWDPDNNVFSN